MSFRLRFIGGKFNPVQQGAGEIIIRVRLLGIVVMVLNQLHEVAFIDGEERIDVGYVIGADKQLQVDLR